MLAQIEKYLLSTVKLPSPLSPIHDAVYTAFHNFVKKGHKLEDLPWFAFSQKKISECEGKLKNAA